MLRLALLVQIGLPCCSANAFHDAVGAEKYDELQSLIANGAAGLNERGPGGQTPLMMSVLMGRTKAVKLRLASGADTTIPEQDGYTTMHGAGFQGRGSIGKLLINHGLNPSDMHKDGFTPIHRACWGRDVRHAETVRVFLEAGVPWDFAAKNGQTPLAMCKQRGHPMAVKALEEWREKSQKEL